MNARHQRFANRRLGVAGHITALWTHRGNELSWSKYGKSHPASNVGNVTRALAPTCIMWRSLAVTIRSHFVDSEAATPVASET